MYIIFNVAAVNLPESPAQLQQTEGAGEDGTETRGCVRPVK